GCPRRGQRSLVVSRSPAPVRLRQLNSRIVPQRGGERSHRRHRLQRILWFSLLCLGAGQQQRVVQVVREKPEQRLVDIFRLLPLLGPFAIAPFHQQAVFTRKPRRQLIGLLRFLRSLLVVAQSAPRPRERSVRQGKSRLQRYRFL